MEKGPAIGQALGPLGLNMADFCKQFNEVTKNYEKDLPLPVALSGNYLHIFHLMFSLKFPRLCTAYANRTFTFVVKAPTTSYLLKKCADVKKGAARYS